MDLRPLTEFLLRHVTTHRDRRALVVEKPGFSYADCYLFRLEVETAALEAFRPAMLALLAEYPDPDHLERGPTYHDVQVHLKDTGRAVAFFGLGQMLGLWRVVTPITAGHAEPRAAQMAAGGYILISGYRAVDRTVTGAAS